MKRAVKKGKPPRAKALLRAGMTVHIILLESDARIAYNAMIEIWTSELGDILNDAGSERIIIDFLKERSASLVTLVSNKKWDEARGYCASALHILCLG
jgi:hypothetical protein